MKDKSSWRKELDRLATRAASSVDDFLDIRWQRLRKRLGWEGRPQIQPYIGYANAQRVWLHGRVLTNPPAELPGEDDKLWENIANAYRRFASDEVAGCQVEVRLGDAIHRMTTDAEGYFYLNVEHSFPDTTHGLWSTAALQIVDHPRVAPEDSTATCRVLTPSTEASFGVISDVDDTILHTGATRLLTMVKITFLANARTRLPLAGAATLYHALQGTNKPGRADRLNPIFYVSSSPWNLFDLLEDFLELNDIPLGPLLLRDLGFDSNKFLKEGHEHKLDKIRQLMASYPKMLFVLFGDSGQDDARLYAIAAAEFPGRIKAIFIRDVDPDIGSEYDNIVMAAIDAAHSVGVPMHLVANSTQAAEIAASLELIDEGDIALVRAATEKDQTRGVV